MKPFVLFKDRKGEFRWHLRGRNRRIICQSEIYQTKQSALKGIRAVLSCMRIGALGSKMLMDWVEDRT